MKPRALRLLLAALLLCSAGPLGAQLPTVDPVLQKLLSPEARHSFAAAAHRAPPAAPLTAVPLEGVLQLRSDAQGRATVPLLVELRDGRGLADLRALGAEIGSVVGDIVTLELRLDALERLFGLPSLRHVQAARTLHLVNEISMTLIRADQVRRREGQLWTGYAGQGVIVGIYDTGIDFRHEDFRHPDGSTRLLGLWDQTRSGGPPPTGFSYGYYCDPASLDSGACPQRDTNGHGTHVAGSAAGNGSATGPGAQPYRFAGVAPMADILVVNGYQNGGFPTNRVIDGVNWIFAEAERLGRPAVVNLSLGGQSGPRDGTALHEVAIDQLSGPGRVTVVAAGNSGQNGTSTTDLNLFHAAVPGTPGPHTIGFQISPYNPTAGSCENELGFELWYGGTDRIRATVVRPDGSSFAAETGESVFQAHPAGNIEFILPEAPRPRNDDRTGVIWVDDCRPESGAPAPGEWTIRYELLEASSGKALHTWIFFNQLGRAPRARGTSGFDNAFVVASPGTAHRAITVGSFTSRNSWVSPVGTFSINTSPPGEISNFSSGGPTRDGRIKPEITAPGSVIMSSHSQDVPSVNVDERLLDPGRRHIISQGTSMAAPHVAGAVALLLQRAGRLTPEEARQVLAETAIQDEFTARSYTQVPVTGQVVGHPNPQWGYGKLDVAAAVEAVSGLVEEPTLLVDAIPVRPPHSSELSARGARLTLLRLMLRADGPEPVDVRQLGFRVTGDDPGAQLIVVRRFGEPSITAQDEVLRSAPAPLAGDTVLVTVAFGAGELRVAPGDSVGLLIGLELSGQAPHNAVFRGFFTPRHTLAEGATTGTPAALRQPGTVVPGNQLVTTLLQPGEVLALSENPIRSGRLVINFATRPDRVAAVYTLSGRRVVDFLPRIERGDRRLEWDLTNEQGAALAPGVYVLVFDVGDRIERQRLIVQRPAGN